MIRHYVKVAVRNLLKYKTQSIISIVGLAVGFTCFTLATLWIRYEMTFDGFHPDADRLYMVYHKNADNDSMFDGETAYPLSNTLKREFPEIEECSGFLCWRANVTTEESQEPLQMNRIIADSNFLNMFHIRLLAGNLDFLEGDDKVALTSEAARQLFGMEDPIGKTIKHYYPQTVCAVVSGWGEHSNQTFGMLSGVNKGDIQNWGHLSYRTWVKLRKGVDEEAFRSKLYKHSMDVDGHGYTYTVRDLELMPATHCRYTLYADEIAVKFQYLILFSVTGGLVILSVLFNYLALFASRLRMRVREMALRKVSGASGKHLYELLCTEFVLVLLCALILGMAFVELSLPAFERFTRVGGDTRLESLGYFVGLILLAMLPFFLLLFYANRGMMSQALKGTTGRTGRQLFYKVSIGFQICVSVLFVFCVFLIMKQLHHLRTVDTGMERKNMATLQVLNNKADLVYGKLTQLPFVTDVLGGCYSLFPQNWGFDSFAEDWDGRKTSDQDIIIETILRGEQLAKYYKFKLLKGEMLPDEVKDPRQIVINETAAKTFGWDNPIGKKIKFNYYGERIVVGVIKDFHKGMPTEPVGPVMLMYDLHYNLSASIVELLIKYEEGSWKDLRNAVDSLGTHELQGELYRLYNTEREYEELLKSENALLKLLTFEGVVCVLISVFGIYSFVTLTCERRRKEIAIRKVNGAKVRDILFLFLKEYLLMLVVASAIAFPIGYALMKRWIENYVEQTPISWWVYGVVFAGIACVVLLSIWTRVWKAARQNPAEVIKSE